MRLGFAGTPAFSVPVLEALRAAGHEIAVVYTQPDRPAGRGRKMQASSVGQKAAALGLALRKPLRLDEAEAEHLQSLSLDALVVVAYGLILPAYVLNLPRLGCLNVHASLLPRWRGAAPIQRALLAGDTHSGVCIMQMDVGLDTGPVLQSRSVELPPNIHAGELMLQLSALGAEAMVQVLSALDEKQLAAVAQDESAATYAAKISKDEARLDWSLPALQLHRCIRAYNPVPVAWSTLGAERVRFYAADLLPDSADATPGTVLAANADGIRVAAKEGQLLLQQVQFPGGRALPAAEAAHSRDLVGQRFG